MSFIFGGRGRREGEEEGEDFYISIERTRVAWGGQDVKILFFLGKGGGDRREKGGGGRRRRREGEEEGGG